MKHRKYLHLILVTALLFSATVSAQNLLSKNISLTVNRQRLEDVLEILSNKGDFYFSYNSSIIKKDSLVSFSAQNRAVRDILGSIFNTSYEFIESGNYIIIRKAPIRLVMVTKKATEEERIYSVSGFVYDEQSGAAINEASIYEKRLLASAMTNETGYFKLRLKSGKASFAELTVSKEFYVDTTVKIEPRHSQELTITMMPLNQQENTTIGPQDLLLPDSLKPRFDPNFSIRNNIAVGDTGVVERTGVGKFLVSARQKVQSLNLKNFFTQRPFQVSLLPWVGTHGKLSGQVTNNFSLNVLGGYTAGTNGVEIGGLFNINKKDVKYFQAGGLFNAVGGELKGVQVAGVNNMVLDSVRGFQVAGVNNLVRGRFNGFQVGGVYNHVSDSVKGVQVAGVANFSRRKLSGVQVAGVINFSNKETAGAQIAGVINYSKKLKGLQIGLINISDTSEGYSIGLVNIVLKGYHKLAVYTNEVTDFNLAFKTGNSKLYSILSAGMNTGSTDKMYAFGYGLGSEINITKKKNFTINPELTSQYLYLGSVDYTNILNKIHLHFNLKLNKYISVFAGPSYALFVSDQRTAFAGYKPPIRLPGNLMNNAGNDVRGWFGWNAGINLF